MFVTYVASASIFAWIIGTLIDILFTSLSSVAINTVALEPIHKILQSAVWLIFISPLLIAIVHYYSYCTSGTIQARIGSAIVMVDFTVCSLPAWSTAAFIAIQKILYKKINDCDEVIV